MYIKWFVSVLIPSKHEEKSENGFWNEFYYNIKSLNILRTNMVNV